MSKIFDLLSLLNEVRYVSGTENTNENPPKFINHFKGFEHKIDSCGNLLFVKKSGLPTAKKILIEAHLDQIGFCVKDITKEGFISVCACGGMDADMLPGTEVVSLGKTHCKGIACSVPPHLLKKEKNENLKISDLYFDFGFSSKKEAQKYLNIGDTLVFSAPLIPLNFGKICGPALDNKAAAASLLYAMEKAESPHDLYFLFSVGEETTSRGVIAISESIKPDIAIVVDAGFALTPGLKPENCILMDKGPSVSFTDTLSTDLPLWVETCAKKKALPLQVICEAGGTGTSATKLQLQCGGTPSVVLSIPLKNMHTPSEIVSEEDILNTARLILSLISEEELPCQEVILIEKR